MSNDDEYDDGYEYDLDVNRIESSTLPKPFIKVFSTSYYCIKLDPYI